MSCQRRGPVGGHWSASLPERLPNTIHFGRGQKFANATPTFCPQSLLATPTTRQIKHWP